MERNLPLALLVATWLTGREAGNQVVCGAAAQSSRNRARRLFAGTVLAGLEPGALLLTGDLVDGKTALGRGHQLKTEWEVSSRSWETIHSKP